MADNPAPVQKKLIRCFRETFGDNLPSDPTTATSENTAGWDSMMTWTLVMLLQEQFGITIGLDQIPNLSSFAAVESYIIQKTGG